MPGPKTWAISMVSERMLCETNNHSFLKCTLQAIQNKSFYWIVSIQQEGETMPCPRNPSSSELVPGSEKQEN